MGGEAPAQHSDGASGRGRGARRGSASPAGPRPSPRHSLPPSPRARNSPAPEAVGSPLPHVCPCAGATAGAGHGDMPAGTPGDGRQCRAVPRGPAACLRHIPSSNPWRASHLLPPPSSARPWGAGLEPPTTESHQPPCCPLPPSTSAHVQSQPCAYAGAGAQHGQKRATSSCFPPALAKSFGAMQGTSHPDPEIWGFSARV